MVEKYSIKSRAHCCHLTGETFEEEQPFIAAIFPDPESSGYLRLDYSIESWDAREDETQPFSFWRSHYKPPVKEEDAQVTPHDPETLFAKLVEDDEAHTENARFILAAMLERKKVIRETDTQQLPTGLLRIYENRKTGDVFIVKDPQIALADVESIQEEVQQLLDPEKYAAPKTEEEAATATENNTQQEAGEESSVESDESASKSEDEDSPEGAQPVEPEESLSDNEAETHEQDEQVS